MAKFYRVKRVKLYPELNSIVLTAADSTTYPLEYKTYVYHPETDGFNNKLRELFDSICDGELYFPYLERTKIFTEAMYNVSVIMVKDKANRLPSYFPFKNFWNTPYYEGVKEKYYLIWVKELKNKYEINGFKRENNEKIVNSLDNIIKYTYKQKPIKGRIKWPF